MNKDIKIGKVYKFKSKYNGEGYAKIMNLSPDKYWISTNNTANKAYSVIIILCSYYTLTGNTGIIWEDELFEEL